jgi:hypothetical protein
MSGIGTDSIEEPDEGWNEYEGDEKTTEEKSSNHSHDDTKDFDLID